ncbi:MAG TPA: AI-2E family transporter [Candidatus Ornithomonoglobus intestinigallinarum]|uniref:AI-2E family transporter n=1 Tax=Candidatus Ornithomonoglobus intestinigallinarum TaxID=2840894 RepID=A0A9D1H2H7_9FIRM|nr:AI-2E family transporter [Candidatus Ornithomonoglobus intestinigallinarum]
MTREIKKYIKIGIVFAALYLAVENIEFFWSVVQNISSAVFPLVLGLIIAYIMSLILKPLEKIYFPKARNKILIKSRRPVCVLLSFLIICLVIALVLVMVVPEIIASSRLIAREIPEFYNGVYNWIAEKSAEIPEIQQWLPDLRSFDIAGAVGRVADFVISGAGGMINSAIGVVSGVFGGIANFVIAIIFAVYLLFNKERLLNQVERVFEAYIKVGNKLWFRHVAETANRSFSRFIVGQCTEAVILGLLCIIGMKIFRFPYAVMTGTVVGVTALIPIIGAFLGAIIGAFMIFTVDPMQALLFLIFLIILMQIEGNLIYPRVVGNSIGLPGMWVLAAVTIGGGLWGVTGMLFGVPAAATIYKLMRESVNGRLATVAEPEPDADKTEERRKGEDGGKV